MGESVQGIDSMVLTYVVVVSRGVDVNNTYAFAVNENDQACVEIDGT